MLAVRASEKPEVAEDEVKLDEVELDVRIEYHKILKQPRLCGAVCF